MADVRAVFDVDDLTFLAKSLFSTFEGHLPCTGDGAFGSWESSISVRVSCSRRQPQPVVARHTHTAHSHGRAVTATRPDSMLEDAHVTDERQMLKAGLSFGKRRPGLDIATC